MNHNANINPKVDAHLDTQPNEFNSKGWDSLAPSNRPTGPEGEPH